MNCTGTTEIEIHEKKTSKVSCKTDDTINSKTVGTRKTGGFLRFSKVALVKEYNYGIKEKLRKNK